MSSFAKPFARYPSISTQHTIGASLRCFGVLEGIDGRENSSNSCDLSVLVPSICLVSQSFSPSRFCHRTCHDAEPDLAQNRILGPYRPPRARLSPAGKRPWRASWKARMTPATATSLQLGGSLGMGSGPRRPRRRDRPLGLGPGRWLWPAFWPLDRRGMRT